MHVGNGLTVNSARGSTGDYDFVVFGSDHSNREMITTHMAKTMVMLLSGGAGASKNEFDYLDTSFFVSGSIGSRGTSERGTSVFGGDVFISGSVYDQNGQIGMFTRQKVVQKQSVETNSNQNITISGLDMSAGKFDPNYIDVYINGQILASGSASQILNGEADYSITGNDTVKFSFDTEIDDIISVLVFPSG